MQKFAFIIHPIDAKRDVSRKYPIARYLPERWIEWLIQRRDPLVVADLHGIRSITGEEAQGWIGLAAELAVDPLHARVLGARAREAALELGWDRVVRRLEAVLLSATGQTTDVSPSCEVARRSRA